MYVTKIQKGNGKYRTIYIPSHDEKRHLRSLIGDISDRVNKSCPKNVVHGFIRHRSPVTCALAHVGHRFTVTMDLRDFFDSIKEQHIKNKLPQTMLPFILVDGAPRQGLPTSPSVANLAASDMDKAIIKWIDKYKLQIVYTRYADDLSFSCDDEQTKNHIIKDMPQIVNRCGFKLAPEKTNIYDSKSGKRIVVGIAVDNDGIHPTREVKRKLRAAKHQQNKNAIMGLEEWSKLKLPRRLREGSCISLSLEREEELAKLSKAWKLGNIYINKIPERPEDIQLGDNCIITGDPIMILGMSTFTTGWISCMRHPDGAYRRGTIYWLHLRGTSVAYLDSGKTKIINGVERPAMQARALVHRLRTDPIVMVYDRLYGDSNSIDKLKNTLTKNGILSITEAKIQYPKAKVLGHAPATWRAYFDNLLSITSTANTGCWSGKKVRVVHI